MSFPMSPEYGQNQYNNKQDESAHYPKFSEIHQYPNPFQHIGQRINTEPQKNINRQKYENPKNYVKPVKYDNQRQYPNKEKYINQQKYEYGNNYGNKYYPKLNPKNNPKVKKYERHVPKEPEKKYAAFPVYPQAQVSPQPMYYPQYGANYPYYYDYYNYRNNYVIIPPGYHPDYSDEFF